MATDIHPQTQLKTILDNYQSSSFDGLPADAEKLAKELTALFPKVDSSRRDVKDQAEMESILKDRSVTVICPIPLPDDATDPLYASGVQERLNKIFEDYLSARGLSFIKADSEIYTTLVLDADQEEMVQLSRAFYQAFMLHSAEGENLMIYPREEAGPRVVMKGWGWAKPEKEEPFVTVPLSNGKSFRFTFQFQNYREAK